MFMNKQEQQQQADTWNDGGNHTNHAQLIPQR